MPHAAVPVRWEIAEDQGFSNIARKGEALARPELGGGPDERVTDLAHDVSLRFFAFSIAPSQPSREVAAPVDLLG